MSVEVLRLSEFLFLWRIVLLFFIGDFSIYRVLAHYLVPPEDSTYFS